MKEIKQSDWEGFKNSLVQEPSVISSFSLSLMLTIVELLSV